MGHYSLISVSLAAPGKPSTSSVDFAMALAPNVREDVGDSTSVNGFDDIVPFVVDIIIYSG